jgi:CRISPR-associated protein Csb2
VSRSFSLVIEYLTGYAVATDPANRERAEWPPHPARVFMALAAAHFETEPANAAQREALEWLATLEPPDMTVPPHTLRDVQAVYVPVNDQSGGEALLKRSRQPRYFPRVHIGSEPLTLTWHASDEPPARHFDALESICRNVTRIGHSSSLVWIRLERHASQTPTHVPDEHSLERGLRIVHSGALQRLEGAFNKPAIDEFAELEEQISSSKGKLKKSLQAKRDEQFPNGKPTSQRPVFSISRGYRLMEPTRPGAAVAPFDPNFIVLRESDDAEQTFGLESTALVTDALRKLIMSESPIQPVPSWVGGHEPNGDKLTSQNHMALIPLAFVGHKHADGHLMGVGIVLPRHVALRERAKVLSPMLFDNTNQPKTLELKMGSVGVWKLIRETDLSPKLTLQTRTYTGPCASWASVTPVLLDRMPKADRVKNPIEWREEVASIIVQSCRNVGLPEPIAVRVEKTPFFLGSLRAMPGQGGFPQLRKGKFQVHVAIEFDRAVQGPVLIGAGRYRGYGLMRPWTPGEGQ